LKFAFILAGVFSQVSAEVGASTIFDFLCVLAALQFRSQRALFDLCELCVEKSAVYS